METKTNVMRILDSKKIVYKIYNYIDSGFISGVDVARYLNKDFNEVFKTLVTVGKSNNFYVFLIPVHKELDLKKAAKCVSEKSIELVKSKDLLQLTGYIHGCCSPIGMKKSFKTVIDESINNLESIIFSGGKIGYQVEVCIDDLKKVVNFKVSDLCCGDISLV